MLTDKIVESAEEVDLGLIFGIGFPPFRGGLLRYADGEGLDRVLESLQSMQRPSMLIDTAKGILKKSRRAKEKFYDS